MKNLTTADRSRERGFNANTVIEELVKVNYEDRMTSPAGSSPTISVRQNPPRGQQATVRVRGEKAPVMPSTSLIQPAKSSKPARCSIRFFVSNDIVISFPHDVSE